MASPEQLLRDMLQVADVQINGPRLEDLQVHHRAFFSRVLRQGTLGLGEAYMDGWWDCQALDVAFYKILRAGLRNRVSRLHMLSAGLRARFGNGQSRRQSQRVARLHYDLGNGFYQDMLDPWMQYTCAYWRRAKNLAAAQEHKLDLVCRKLQLKEGEHILELGGGWGGFARFAAQRYGCHVTSYNISAEQARFAREWNRDLPVVVIQKDYRDAVGQFDKVVSIGLCEHVGYKNHRRFFQVQERCLKEDGLMLLHTIGRRRSARTCDPWIGKYIFPGGLLPSLEQLAAASEGIFVLEDLQNLGADYDRTLMAWYQAFIDHWPAHRERLGERFFRMWSYYLLSCAGAFRARDLQLWQMVFSRKGVEGGYLPVR
jgi:cyclopropane-fatty-acyl-phospholipid synthase